VFAHNEDRTVHPAWSIVLIATAVALLSVWPLNVVGKGVQAMESRTPAESAQDLRRPSAFSVPRSREGLDVVGKPAPDWGKMVWLNSPPLALKELRGKVALLRFWTNTCPFCEATAPALRRIHQDCARRGVVVIGMYHPKPPGTHRPVEEVRRTVQTWGWQFPVAIDEHWRTLNAFWLHGPRRQATSASFLLDRNGIIRFVHPGPEFHPDGPPDHQQCRDDYRDLRRAIEALLAESASPGARPGPGPTLALRSRPLLPAPLDSAVHSSIRR
jgi:thiol-disulfide isomerase/thioredoxin